MKNLLWNFQSDERGFIVSAELVLIGTILVLGLIVGMSCIRTAVLGEMQDVAAAIGSLNQSYSYSGFLASKGFGWGGGGFGGFGGFGGGGFGCKSWSPGSAFFDRWDGQTGIVATGPGFAGSDVGVCGPVGGPVVAPGVAPVITAPAPSAACPTGNCPPGTTEGQLLPQPEHQSLPPAAPAPAPAPSASPAAPGV